MHAFKSSKETSSGSPNPTCLAPNVVNTFNETYNWYWNGSSPALSGTNWNSQLGLGSTGADNFPQISFGDAVNGFGITSIGNQWQGNFVSATMITGDSLIWTRAATPLRSGGDFWAYQVNSHSGSGVDKFNFDPKTTAGSLQQYRWIWFCNILAG